jgi:hypothetical protein
MLYSASSVCHCLTMCIRNLNECQCPHPNCTSFFTLPNSMNYGFQCSYLTWGAIAIVPSPTLGYHVFTVNVLCHIAQLNLESFFTQVCSHTSFHFNLKDLGKIDDHFSSMVFLNFTLSLMNFLPTLVSQMIISPWINQPQLMESSSKVIRN